MNHTVPGKVEVVLTGKAAPYSRPGKSSAIHKIPVTGAVEVMELGLAGDEQADLRVHGGPHKAVHIYPREHYSDWQEALGYRAVLEEAGAFGENLSSRGLTEETVCMGDQYRIGSVLFEVSQGRQPCWKLNDRFDCKTMAKQVQDTRRTGWYFRVLEPGTLQAGDDIVLVSRPWPQWSLARFMGLIYDGVLDAPQLREALQLPLVESWEKLLKKRLEKAEVEDWSPRIDGPAKD
ncbi:MOSC domain-containing protein [Aliamphritea spongicola]|uniref:MOSC domain-containing protein n=1 Tax=Aliamphritea spongicola TaxID=707589 RepID=UPI00196AC935|nr:MOSC domain-containing protein [Aliamphritea spongicola]MBN3560998.1 MOSC domain-containing protein [Aliamphritea spongicola]